MTIQREQTTTNVQSATAKDLDNAKAVSLTDFMNSTMQSVSVNDYQGNPFQQDLVFRGFAASPLIGTPQGLSVYVDGVRVNEPFGEVVNWDLIPVNAIQRMDLMPGSDPLFGLNTLGGALAITTKSGFTFPKVEGTVTGGSWGRRQAKVSAGANNGTLGGFVALNYFDEDGWRKNSPSSVRQAYGRLDVQGVGPAEEELVFRGIGEIKDVVRDHTDLADASAGSLQFCQRRQGLLIRLRQRGARQEQQCGEQARCVSDRTVATRSPIASHAAKSPQHRLNRDLKPK